MFYGVNVYQAAKGFKDLSMNHKNANYNNFLHIFCVVISKKVYEGSTSPSLNPPPSPPCWFSLNNQK